MVCSALRCQAWEFLSSLVLTWLHLDRSVCVYGCVRVCVCAWASECLATRSGHCAVPSSGIVLFHNLTVNKVGRYVLSFRHEEIMPGDGRRVVYTHQDSVSFQIIVPQYSDCEAGNAGPVDGACAPCAPGIPSTLFTAPRA